MSTRFGYKPQPKPTLGKTAVVSSVNGLVVAIPAGSAAVVPRLATRENADVISAARTREVLTGTVTPAEMTEVVTGAAEARGFAAELANQIDDSVVASDIGNNQSELQEPKAKSRRGRAAAARQAVEDSAADSIAELVGKGEEVTKV